MTPLECLSIADTGKMLNVSKSTINHLVSKGDLKAIKVGRRTVVPLRSVSAFIDLAMSGPASSQP